MKTLTTTEINTLLKLLKEIDYHLLKTQQSLDKAKYSLNKQLYVRDQKTNKTKTITAN